MNLKVITDQVIKKHVIFQIIKEMSLGRRKLNELNILIEMENW